MFEKKKKKKIHLLIKNCNTKIAIDHTFSSIYKTNNWFGLYFMLFRKDRDQIKFADGIFISNLMHFKQKKIHFKLIECAKKFKCPSSAERVYRYANIIHWLPFLIPLRTLSIRISGAIKLPSHILIVILMGTCHLFMWSCNNKTNIFFLSERLWRWFFSK